MTTTLGILASSVPVGGGGGQTLPVAPLATYQITNTAAISAGAWTHTCGINVAVGKLMVVAACVSGAAAASFATTDSKGNTWTTTAGAGSGSTTSFGVLAYCVVTNALTTSDTITITANTGTITRVNCSGLSWDWTKTSVVQGAWNPLSSASQVSGSQNVSGRAVLVGCNLLINSGRVPTASAPWTGLPKTITTAGSAERACYAAWRTVDPSAAGVTLPVGYDSTGAGTTSFLAFVE